MKLFNRPEIYRLLFNSSAFAGSIVISKQSGAEQWVQGVKEGNRNLPVDQINAEKQTAYYETLYNSLAQRVNWNIKNDVDAINGVTLNDGEWRHEVKKGNTLSQIIAKFISESGATVSNKKGLTYLGVSYLAYGDPRVNVDYIKPGQTVVIYKEDGRLAIKLVEMTGEGEDQTETIVEQVVGKTEGGEDITNDFNEWLFPAENELPQPPTAATDSAASNNEKFEDQPGYQTIMQLRGKLAGKGNGIASVGKAIDDNNNVALPFMITDANGAPHWFAAFVTKDTAFDENATKFSYAEVNGKGDINLLSSPKVPKNSTGVLLNDFVATVTEACNVAYPKNAVPSSPSNPPPLEATKLPELPKNITDALANCITTNKTGKLKDKTAFTAVTINQYSADDDSTNVTLQFSKKDKSSDTIDFAAPGDITNGIAGNSISKDQLPPIILKKANSLK